MILIETSGSKCGRSVLLTKKMLDVFERPVVFSNFCRTLRIDLEKIMNKYAELWFSHAYATGLIPSYRATSAMPNLDIKSLLRIEKMLIPPLSEQKRIIDVMSSVDAYIAALQQQAVDARAARNAVLHELLTAVGDDWAETTLGALITLEYGKPLKAEDRDGQGFPVFGSAGEVGLHSKPLIARAPVIVVGRKGTAGSVWWSSKPCSVIDTAFYVEEKVELEARFLFLLLNFLDLPALTAQTGVPGLNRDRAYSCAVVMPPRNEQKRIVEVISAMDHIVNATEQTVTEALTLRSGLLSGLLSGEHKVPETYDRLLGAA
jgi:type I restriction enzyme S subunit